MEREGIVRQSTSCWQEASGRTNSLGCCWDSRAKGGGGDSPLTSLYQGPYSLLPSCPKYFHHMVGDKADVISADRREPHLGTTPAEPAMPPARGWPKEPAGHAGVPPVFPASPPPPAPWPARCSSGWEKICQPAWVEKSATGNIVVSLFTWHSWNKEFVTYRSQQLILFIQYQTPLV